MTRDDLQDPETIRRHEGVRCDVAVPAGQRLTVTIRHSREALGRIAATLRTTPVRELTYEVSGGARATAVIVVPRADAVRARNRLGRLVDVLSVTASDASTPERV